MGNKHFYAPPPRRILQNFGLTLNILYRESYTASVDEFEFIWRVCDSISIVWTETVYTCDSQSVSLCLRENVKIFLPQKLTRKTFFDPHVLSLNKTYEEFSARILLRKLFSTRFIAENFSNNGENEIRGVPSKTPPLPTIFPKRKGGCFGSHFFFQKILKIF